LGLLIESESAIYSASTAALRLEISLWLVDDFVKEQREMEEEC
jgi:hypothetical protein